MIPNQNLASVNESEIIATLEYLIKQGARFDVKDSQGRDVMTYAI